MSKPKKRQPDYQLALRASISARLDAIEAQIESSTPEQRERLRGDLEAYGLIVDALIRTEEQSAQG